MPTRRGSTWTAALVRRILTGREVLGYFRHRGEWHRGQHEPIVGEVVWLAAQALAERRAKYAPRGAGRLPKRHLFVQGMLKCGVCGATMIPRSARDSRDTYECKTRKVTGGADACPMLPLPRVSVDYAAIQLFTRWALDIEGTRQKVAEATIARLAEVHAQAQRAERGAAELRSQQARVERDYRRGALPAEDYARFRAEIASELEAVGAEAERLAAHADEVRAAAATLTAEQDVLRRIHDLYAALTDRMRAAAEASEIDADVGPLRAALGQVFEQVVVRWPQVADLDDPTVFIVPGAPGLPHLEPRLRREVFDADAPTLRDQWESLRCVALDLGVDPDSVAPHYSADNNSNGSGVPL